MSEDNYIVRTPLLDAKQQVKGYQLAWQKKASRGDPLLLQLLVLLLKNVESPVKRLRQRRLNIAGIAMNGVVRIDPV